MCIACSSSLTKARVLSKNEFSPEEERVFQSFLSDYLDALQPIEDEIEDFVAGASASDLESLDSIRSEIQSRTGVYTADFEAVFRSNAEDGLLAGRQLAVRQSNLDVAFDIIPERALEEIDDWVSIAAGSTLETITEDSARWLRGAHRDGLGLDEIADQLNVELFQGRLEGYVADRAARTATIATSNTGAHSAIVESSAIGEQWITSIDDRERESHADAHQQVVAVDTAFEVGGVFMQHPGDPSAPVGEIANCRCTVVAVFADQLTESEREAIDAGERITVAI